MGLNTTQILPLVDGRWFRDWPTFEFLFELLIDDELSGPSFIIIPEPFPKGSASINPKKM